MTKIIVIKEYTYDNNFCQEENDKKCKGNIAKVFSIRVCPDYFIESTISFIVSQETRPVKVYRMPSATKTAAFSDT